MDRDKNFAEWSTEEIVDEYADMVYRLALTKAGNREDAQDIFQEVFLRLVKYRNRILSIEHLKAWLIRVTINCARKHTGSLWKKRVQYFEEEDVHQLHDPDSKQEYERVENHDSPMTKAVKQLAEIYRIVIYLFYYEDLSIEQISSILEEKESTIKSRLHRARELLKAKLKGGTDL